MGNSNDSAASLPFLNADSSRVTFYGWGSGCYMAQQMSIIYSRHVAGISVAACGVYGETPNSFYESYPCTDERRDELVADITSKAYYGLIDS